MKKVTRLLIWAVLVGAIQPGPSAFSAVTRTIDADALISSDHTKTYTLPATGGTLAKALTYEQETPIGTVNGSNTAFTLSQTPYSAKSVILTLDGQVLTQGAGQDYTISGTSITFATAPATAQILWAVYPR